MGARIPRRRRWSIFVVASMARGLVIDVNMLVVAPALQAMGGGAFMPAATGLRGSW